MVKYWKLALAFVVAVVAGAAAPPAEAAFTSSCVYERPCVFVSPDVDRRPVKRGTVLRFRGHGWKPRSVIEASYGSYCPPLPPGTLCAGTGLAQTFRTDRRGRFRFTFRYGSRPPRGVRGPTGAGSEEVTFSGRNRRGRWVDRFAVPPPPRSTRGQRRQARAVRDATLALLDDLRRAAPRTFKAQEAYERQVSRCQDIITMNEPPRQAAVIDSVVSAALEQATSGQTGPELERFARRLERLGLRDPALAAGAAAWVAAIRAPRYAPSPSLCAVLERWRDTGFAPEAEPVDPAAPGLAGEVAGSDVVRAAARRLRDLGVGREDQDLFAGDVIGLEVYLGVY